MPMRPALLVIAALVLGAVVRLVPLLAYDFPLNDGGLFFVMSEDLRSAGFSLPATTSYNFDPIPFAYPPLAIYVHAVLAEIGFDPLELLRWIPFVASAITIPLVYRVANELVGSWRVAGVAAIAYALLPRAYEWLITGGGLTRSLGMVFALLAVWQGIRLIRRPRARAVIVTGVLGGLTVLTHPEAAVFVLVTLTTFLVGFGRSIRPAIALVAAGVVGLLVSAPWWAGVFALHGPSILVGAAGSRSFQMAPALRQFVFGEFTGAAELDIFLGIGFVGLLLQLARREYLVPVWLAVTVVAILASGFTYAAVSWAIVIAYAVVDLLVPATVGLARTRLGPAVVAGGLLGAAVLSSLAIQFNVLSPVHAVSPEQQAAMSWVASSTPPEARFLVVTGQGWPLDATSEWFPALANRVSIATVQGYEWTAGFAARQRAYDVLQTECARRSVSCLEDWIDRFGGGATHVYVAKGRLAGLGSRDDCCPALRDALEESLEVVYDDAGATILRLGWD